MNSLIICLPKRVSLEVFCGRLSDAGLVVGVHGNRADINFKGSVGWVEIDLLGELRREYEANEIETIEAKIGDWVGYIVDYRHIGVAEAVVRVACQYWGCVVDDEAGFFGDGAQYLAID